MKIEDLHK